MMTGGNGGPHVSAKMLAADRADRDQYIRELDAAVSAMNQEEASANLARDRRVTEARIRFKEAREHAWQRYSQKISGGDTT